MSHTDSSDDDDGFYGPSLPPASPQPESSQEVIGPVLPSQWNQQRDDEEEDDVTIGPLLPGESANDPHRNHQPVLRKSAADGLPKREEWMTVIPEKVEKRLGFKSVTSFSQRPIGPAADKKEALKIELPIETITGTAVSGTTLCLSPFFEQFHFPQERKRESSLLETHQDQIKKKVCCC